jgi:hypothetical protein
LLRLGAYILLAAILLQVGIRVLWMLIRAEPITSTDFFDTFYSALLYYFVALLTVPLWLKAVTKAHRQVLFCFVLAVLSFGVYQLLFALLYPREFVGVVQLLKLLLSAKFNYFNLTAGALVGLGIGIQLRRSIGDERVTNRYFLFGIALLVIGMMMSVPAGGVEAWYQVARQIAAWKWVAHLGVVLVLVAALSWVLDRKAALGSAGRTTMQLLAIFGQCSLPVWILHHFVSDIKDFLDLIGMKDAISLAISMGVFFGVTSLIMRRLYVLYYGSLRG